MKIKDFSIADSFLLDFLKENRYILFKELNNPTNQSLSAVN